MFQCKISILLRYLIIISILVYLKAASFKQLDDLVQEKFTDQTSVIRLANQEKFSIPLNGRYISYDIKYYPQKSQDCIFKEPTVEYKKIAQSNKLFEEQDEVINMIVLKRSEKVILADPYFNILVYSTDEHKLLRLLSPKTSLLSSNTEKKLVQSVSMITTEDENYVYYLSPNNSFVFSTKSLGSQITKLNITLPFITKTIYYRSYVILLSKDDGITVYNLNKTSHQFAKVQTLANTNNRQYIDMQLDTNNELLYVLTESNIQVFTFQPSQFPNPQTHQFSVIQQKDSIDVSNFTRNHAKSGLQNNQLMNLQISSVNSNQNQLFVLFRHNMRQNVIAEFVYDVTEKKVTFLRYFKFQMLIKEIHTIQDVIVVVGNEILGMFPYGIDPRLIKQEFNGWIAMSDIQKLVITQAPYFIGVTKNSIQYGGLLFSQQIGLNCQFKNSESTKSIQFSGNLTWCNSEENQFYNTYCSYRKTFILESMDIVTSSTVSSSVWIIMLICTFCIIFGILIMLIMHKKKQDEIRKLQLYFQEKRRTQIPASSDRRGNI